MAIVEKSAGGDAPEVPDGLYEVECVSTKEVTVEKDPFGNPEKIEFRLHIVNQLDADGEEIYLDPRVNRKFSEKSILFKWAVAFGLDVSKPSIDTDAFLGKHARALIHNPVENGWPRVKDIMPLPKANGRSAPPQRPTNGHAEPDVDTDAISAWWAETRKQGFDRKDVIETAQTLFDKEPVALTAVERAELMKALIG